MGSLTLLAPESGLVSAAIDSAGGFAYFGTYYSGAVTNISKVRLSDFTSVKALNLSTGESVLKAAADGAAV